MVVNSCSELGIRIFITFHTGINRYRDLKVPHCLLVLRFSYQFICDDGEVTSFAEGRVICLLKWRAVLTFYFSVNSLSHFPVFPLPSPESVLCFVISFLVNVDIKVFSILLIPAYFDVLHGDSSLGSEKTELNKKKNTDIIKWGYLDFVTIKVK